MIGGVAIVPATPLLVPGVTACLPLGVDRVAAAARAALAALPSCDVTVLLAAAAWGEHGSVHARAVASMAGIGRPEVRIERMTSPGIGARVTATTRYPLTRSDRLPLELAVLAWHAPERTTVVPVAVPPTASAQALVAVGASIARALEEVGATACVVAAGDLSAGLTERSPLHRVEGAWLWDEQAAAAVDSGRLSGLERLGPDEARRVGARGWAPLTVLHGVSAHAKIGTVVRHYSAPRGVGYLVASG